MNDVTFSKLKLIALLALIGIFNTACEAEEEEPILLSPQPDSISIQLDYLGSDGSYNDNISSVPYGLVLGLNGPYTFEAARTYHIEYRPSGAWTTPVTLDWTPNLSSNNLYINDAYKIRCWREGNMGYIRAGYASSVDNP